MRGRGFLIGGVAAFLIGVIGLLVAGSAVSATGPGSVGVFGYGGHDGTMGWRPAPAGRNVRWAGSGPGAGELLVLFSSGSYQRAARAAKSSTVPSAGWMAVNCSKDGGVGVAGGAVAAGVGVDATGAPEQAANARIISIPLGRRGKAAEGHSHRIHLVWK